MTTGGCEGIYRTSRWRWTIFGIAVLMRLWFGGISFGSVDLTRSLFSTQDLLAGKLWVDVPYMPTMSVFLILGGVLSLKTSLPIALGFKLYPIFFDSLLAVVVYDIVNRRAPHQARTAGLLYALAPVPILITCFHAQWDAIWLFFALFAFYVREEFAESRAKYAFFGALFAMAFLCKPVVLLLAPLFIPADAFHHRSKENWRRVAAAVAGFGGVMALAMAVFSLAGYSLIARMNAIVDYSAGGIIIFGLPFAFPFDHIPLLRERACLLIILMAVVIPFMRQRIDTYSSILAMFCGALGVSGLCPQYLMWPVPLLLVTRRWRCAVAYQVLATVFLLFYYLNPTASYFPFENMATFALLKPLSWAMPPTSWTTEATMPLLCVLGNCGLPFFFLGLMGWMLSRTSQQPDLQPPSHDAGPQPSLGSLGSFYGPVLCCLGASIACLRVLVYSPDMATVFSTEWAKEQAAAQYCAEFWTSSKAFVGVYPETSVFHLGWGILLGVCAWAAFALLAERKWRKLPQEQKSAPATMTLALDANPHV